MNYFECSKKVKDYRQFIGEYLDKDNNITEDLDEAICIIKEIVITPSDDALPIFWTRYKETGDFQKALDPHRHEDDLQINFYAKNLATNEFGFLPVTNF